MEIYQEESCMSPIFSYLLHAFLPEDKAKAKKVQHKAGYLCIMMIGFIANLISLPYYCVWDKGIHNTY